MSTTAASSLIFILRYREAAGAQRAECGGWRAQEEDLESGAQRGLKSRAYGAEIVSAARGWRTLFSLPWRI
jgi:hypothetical protein